MELQSSRSIALKLRWLFFITMLVILYLAGRMVQAQDVSIDSPTATLIATDEATVATDAVTESLLTPAAADSTALATDLLVATLFPTDEPTTQPTDVFAATLFPSDEPPATSVPANISIAADKAYLPENSILTLTVSAEGLSDVYHIAIACQVDPTLLRGVQAASGDMLLAHGTSIIDSGFQTNGLWVLIGKPPDSPSPLAGTGTLWTFTYQVLAAGATQIVCQTQIEDQNNQLLPLVNSSPELTVEGYQDTTAVGSPTILATETEVPTLPIASEVTAETPTLVPQVSIQSIPLHVYGSIEATVPLTAASITITGTDFNQIIDVQTNGAFGFDLPVGEYQFIFNALYCVPQVLAVVVADKPQKLPSILLLGGDVDGNHLIDMADVMLMTQNFGTASPLADLNQDGMVNIYDLALVSANIDANP